jgi:hypothetical protein
MSSRTKKKCRNKWEQLLEQHPIIVGIILCVISNKNKYSVRTNLHLISNKKILIQRKILKRKEYKMKTEKSKVENKKWMNKKKKEIK